MSQESIKNRYTSNVIFAPKLSDDYHIGCDGYHIGFDSISQFHGLTVAGTKLLLFLVLI